MKEMITYNSESKSFNLVYDTDTACENNSAVNISTRIVFSCVPGSQKVRFLVGD